MPETPSQPDDTLLQGGTYARKQLFGRASLLKWSHGSRFQMARALVAPHAPRRLLDYGCGDGTFLAMVRDLFPHAVGAEIDPALVADAAERFASLGGLSFVHTADLAREPGGSFGVVACMEVLEHCTPDAVDRVLGELRRLVAPDGVVIISVPVETGPPLVGKQAFRALAAWRGMEGYRHRERYGVGEMTRMLFAGEGTTIERPVYEGTFASGAPNRWHGHKGFNWRALRARIARDFVVRETRFSPLPVALLASQAWFVCAPK